MAEQIILEIEWPKLGIKVEAHGMPFNQKYLEALCQFLPFKSIQQHTLVTGEVMVAYCPVNAWEYAHLTDKKPQRDATIAEQFPVGFVSWGVLGSVGICYGVRTEPALGGYSHLSQGGQIAQIPEKYIADLKKVGRAVWEAVFTTKELIEVEIRVKGR